MTPDVSIVGIGRVGLPLALTFADHGLSVLGIDADADLLDSVAGRRMPFEEPGMQEILERVSDAGRLELSSRVSDAARADNIILTLGTPALAHIEIDTSQIRRVIDDLLPVLRPGHLIVLRSTVAPGTTDLLAGYVAKHRELEVGRDVFLAHVPERIAEHRFLDEIHRLPCIVAGVDERSADRAEELFGRFGTEVVRTAPVQAELAKIWTNILRYTNFALPNLLMMNCEQYDANVYDVIELINRDYPRGGIASPGLTGGTCLRKDFAFSEEQSNAPGMLLAVSRVNESVPLFLVHGLRSRLGDLSTKKVAVLGLAFKRDSDDTRDSLAFKVVRFLERELADITTHDPHVTDPTSQSLEDAVRDADAIVIATNHSDFEGPETARAIRELASPDCLVADPWNVFGQGRVFAPVAAMAAIDA